MEGDRLSIPAKMARFTARHPTKCLLGSLIFASIVSVIGVVGGDFKIEVDNKGWRSRGTLIANREMQNDIVLRLRNDLFQDTDGSVWEDVETNIVRGYLQLEDRDNEDETEEGEDQCDASTFYQKMLMQDNLFAVYEAQNSKSILDADVLFAICEAETKTNEILEQNNVCGCEGDDVCPAPASLLFVLKLYYGDANASCSELKEYYTSDIQEQFTDELVQCTSDILSTYDSTTKSYDAPNCPTGFQATMVDEEFAVDGNKVLKYSSSYFFTNEIEDEALFDIRPQYAQTDNTIVQSTYDTLWEVQNTIYVDSVLLADMVSGEILIKCLNFF